MTPEGKVKARVKSLLAKYSVYYTMPIGQTYGRSGVPDFLCCAEGRFIGIETKAGGNKPSLLQELEMGYINDAGGTTIVVDETGLEALEQILERFTHEHVLPLRCRLLRGKTEVHNETAE